MPATTTSSLDDLILSYSINEQVLEEHRGAALHRALAWISMAGDMRSGVHQFPRYDKTDPPAGVKVEGAAFATVEQTTDSVQATAGVVGLGRELTMEAEQDAATALTDLIMINERGISERVSSDLLALHTTATNTSDFSGIDFGLTQWGEAKTAFMAQNPNGSLSQIAFVGHTETIGQLEASMRLVSSGYGSLYPEFLRNTRGFKGVLENVLVFDSTLVPENDPLNWSSGFGVIGPRGWYGLALWWDVMHRMQPTEQNASSTVYSHTRYGVVGTDQANFREVISAKA